MKHQFLILVAGLSFASHAAAQSSMATNAANAMGEQQFQSYLQKTASQIYDRPDCKQFKDRILSSKGSAYNAGDLYKVGMIYENAKKASCVIPSAVNGLKK